MRQICCPVCQTEARIGDDTHSVMCMKCGERLVVPQVVALAPRRSWLSKAVPVIFIQTALVVLVLAGLGISFTRWEPPRPTSHLTKENFLRVQRGMNHQDVTLILGQPVERKGDYPGLRIWAFREGVREVKVVIDANGNVVEKTQTGLE